MPNSVVVDVLDKSSWQTVEYHRLHLCIPFHFLRAQRLPSTQDYLISVLLQFVGIMVWILCVGHDPPSSLLWLIHNNVLCADKNEAPISVRNCAESQYWQLHNLPKSHIEHCWYWYIHIILIFSDPASVTAHEIFTDIFFLSRSIVAGKQMCY